MGKKINFWNDKWLDLALVQKMNLPSSFHASLKATVNDFISDYKWNIPSFLIVKVPHIVEEIQQVVIWEACAEDVLVWNHTESGSLSFKEAYDYLFPVQNTCSWGKLIWNISIPPSKTFLLWRILLKRVPLMKILK